MITLESHPPLLTAHLDGEIDHHSAKDLRFAIDQAILLQQPQTLFLNFQKVSFMDSSGIGLIIGRYQQMQAFGGTLVIQNPPPHIRRVLRLSGMERLARIEQCKERN